MAASSALSGMMPIELGGAVRRDGASGHGCRLDPASVGIRVPGRAPSDLFGVPGSTSIHGRIRDGDAYIGGGEDQAQWRGRVGRCGCRGRRRGCRHTTGLVRNDSEPSCALWRGIPALLCLS